MNNSGNGNVRSWAIVGGGMMGLTVAWRLAQEGQNVKVIEARPALGGLASAWQLGDVTWDQHYHVTLLSDANLRQLLDQLELGDSMKWVETRTGFYTGGKFYSMSSTLEFLSFPPLNLLEKLRLGGTIFLASKIRNWRRLERIPVEAWLKRWSGAGTFRKIWLPLLRAKLGAAYQRTSAAFIWAHISRMYEARRTGLKKEMFGYVPGGYAQILETMQRKLESQGVEFVLDARIEQIYSETGGQPRIQYIDGTVDQVDEVVITTPSKVVPKLLPQMEASEADLHENIEYLGIVCASLLSKKPLEGYYVTNITDEVPFTAVIEMSTIVPPEELGGHTLVYLPKYATQDDPIFGMSDEEVQSQFLGTFLKMYPHLQRSDIEAFRISRVRNVMAIPTLEYSHRLPPMKSSVPHVHVINSAHILKGNLNVNMTVGLANESFDRHLMPIIQGTVAERSPSMANE